MKASKMLFAVLLGICITLTVSTSSKAAGRSYTKQDLKIMSTIIYCEAGNQSYAGKLAVGCVIMNRKKSSAFPNTIKGVVYQRGQFGPVRTGKLKRELIRYNNGSYNRGQRAQCVKAAKEVLEGQSYVVSKGKKINMKKYRFFNGSLAKAKVRIGGHDFK